MHYTSLLIQQNNTFGFVTTVNMFVNLGALQNAVTTVSSKVEKQKQKTYRGCASVTSLYVSTNCEEYYTPLHKRSAPPLVYLDIVDKFIVLLGSTMEGLNCTQ